jgi:hypothetical protein
MEYRLSAAEKLTSEQGKPWAELKTDLELVTGLPDMKQIRIAARLKDKGTSVVGEEVKFVEILKGENSNKLQLLGRA